MSAVSALHGGSVSTNTPQLYLNFTCAQAGISPVIGSSPKIVFMFIAPSESIFNVHAHVFAVDGFRMTSCHSTYPSNAGLSHQLYVSSHHASTILIGAFV